MTRRISAAAVCTLGCLLGWAAAAAPPSTLSYQGVLTDDQGVVVPDAQYGLLFEVFPSDSGGSPVFSQSLAVEVTSGLYNVLLSTTQPGVLGNDLQLAFDDQNQGRYMQVTIVSSTDPGIAGQVPIPMEPRQEIASVPYALTALSVASGAAPATREVVFVTSTFNAAAQDQIIFGLDGWSALRNSDDTADLVASVTPSSAGCTVEVDVLASFRNGNNDADVLLTITENGTSVGVSSMGRIKKGATEGGSITNGFVRKDAPQTELIYAIRARADTDSLLQGANDFQCSACDPDSDAGAWIKVVMDCGG